MHPAISRTSGDATHDAAFAAAELEREFVLQSLFEQGRLPIAFHEAELSLHDLERRGAPSQLLITCVAARQPWVRSATPPGHDAFDQARGLEADAEPDDVTCEKWAYMAAFTTSYPTPARTKMLARAVGQMLRNKDPNGLDASLADAECSELRAFATRPRRDRPRGSIRGSEQAIEARSVMLQHIQTSEVGERFRVRVWPFRPFV